MALVRDLLATNWDERRRALLSGSIAIAAVAVADLLALGPVPVRLLVWGLWVGSFLAFALAFGRGPAWLARLTAMITSAGSMVALVALAGLGGGTESPYFFVLPTIPLIMVAVAPEDAVELGVAGALVLLGGLLLLARAGHSLGDLVTWGMLILVIVTFAAVHSLRQRSRHERTVTTELERVRALERLAESEQARAQAERWAAIGMLAEGVAHDVNSPLGSLRSNLAFAREELAAGRPEEIDAALADALESVERIREIVASLRAFSLSGTEERERRAIADQASVTPAPLGVRSTPALGVAAVRRPR